MLLRTLAVNKAISVSFGRDLAVDSSLALSTELSPRLGRTSVVSSLEDNLVQIVLGPDAPSPAGGREAAAAESEH